jgi:hypothetical protein
VSTVKRHPGKTTSKGDAPDNLQVIIDNKVRKNTDESGPLYIRSISSHAAGRLEYDNLIRPTALKSVTIINGNRMLVRNTHGVFPSASQV